MFDNLFNAGHSYYLFSTGTNFKGKTFSSRAEAESFMKAYCAKNNISIELTEDDKHEKKYSDHKGVRFYINRV